LIPLAFFVISLIIMEPDPNDNLIKKMLTSKTGANSCCYYSPHPDGEHLLYKWTAYGDSKNVRWYACAGCRSVKNKDNSKQILQNQNEMKKLKYGL
jgi:hypothetical protein